MTPPRSAFGAPPQGGAPSGPAEPDPRRPLGGSLGPRLECKICWTVYDPALGDEVWQIPPGTPFAALPPHWTCPTCSALQQDFLRLDD